MCFEKEVDYATEIHPGKRPLLQLVPFTFCIFGACACSREGWDNWFKSNYETWYSEFLKSCFLALPSAMEPRRYGGMGMVRPCLSLDCVCCVCVTSRELGQGSMPETIRRVWFVIGEKRPSRYCHCHSSCHVEILILVVSFLSFISLIMELKLKTVQSCKWQRKQMRAQQKMLITWRLHCVTHSFPFGKTICLLDFKSYFRTVSKSRPLMLLCSHL
jgi:hypothetical protein